VDIARLAHTTLVVESPGFGDEIQAIKAGILEIADILVVNKADRPGVENTERALRSMLEMAHPTKRVFQHHGLAETIPSSEQAVDTDPLWVPPILRTVATQGDGVPELVGAIARHHAHLEATGEWHDRDRARLQAELDLLIQGNLVTRWRQEVSDSQYQEILDTLVAREISPHQAVKALLDGGQSR